MNLQPALKIAVLGVLSASVTSCKLPPRDAMRMIQTEGLFAYLSSNPSVPDYERITGSPFIPRRAYVAPRPVTPIPYRSTYHTNRHLKADYNRVPYRPKHQVTQSPSSGESGGTTSLATPPPPRLALSNEVPGAGSTPASSPSPATASSPAAPSQPPVKPVENLPYGTPVSGRPGMVTSPYAQKHQLVDVTGLPAGDTVKDPYTGKLFRVPPTQQASAKPSAPKEDKPAADSPAPKP